MIRDIENTVQAGKFWHNSPFLLQTNINIFGLTDPLTQFKNEFYLVVLHLWVKKP